MVWSYKCLSLQHTSGSCWCTPVDHWIPLRLGEKLGPLVVAQIRRSPPCTHSQTLVWSLSCFSLCHKFLWDWLTVFPVLLSFWVILHNYVLEEKRTLDFFSQFTRKNASGHDLSHSLIISSRKSYFPEDQRGAVPGRHNNPFTKGQLTTKPRWFCSRLLPHSLQDTFHADSLIFRSFFLILK